MTPTLSLLLICGLVAGLTLLRWPDRRNLRNLSPASKRFAILVHLGVCLILAIFVWLFTISVGTPLTDYLAVLGLLLVEGLGAGLVSSFGLFSRFVLHIPWFKEDDRKNNERSEIQFEGKIIKFEKFERVQGEYLEDPKVISIQGKRN